MSLPDPNDDAQRVADASALDAAAHRMGEIAWRLKRIKNWLAGPKADQLHAVDMLALDEAIGHFNRCHATLERRRTKASS